MSALDDALYATVEWVPLPSSKKADSLPVATHTGILHIGEVALRVYQLSDGKRIIDAEDVAKLLGFSLEELTRGL